MSKKEKKTRRRFSQDQRDQAVEEYVSGTRSAQQIADELGIEVQRIYRWKTLKEETAKGTRIEELITEGFSKEAAGKILNLELENIEYKKKLAEQIVIVDLLKKIQNPSQQESELTGLINTTRKLGRKRGGAK